MEGMQTEIHSLSKKLKAVSKKLDTVCEELKDVPRELKEVKAEIKIIKKGQAKEWLDSQEVCRALDIGLRTLQHMRNSGEIAYSTFHNKLFYKASDVDAILESNYIKNQPKNKNHD